MNEPWQRIHTSLLEHREELTALITPFLNNLRDNYGYDTGILRMVLFQWLSENSPSREDFEGKAEWAAAERDWPKAPDRSVK